MDIFTCRYSSGLLAAVQLRPALRPCVGIGGRTGARDHPESVREAGAGAAEHQPARRRDAGARPRHGRSARDLFAGKQRTGTLFRLVCFRVC